MKEVESGGRTSVAKCRGAEERGRRRSVAVRKVNGERSREQETAILARLKALEMNLGAVDDMRVISRTLGSIQRERERTLGDASRRRR